MSVTGQVPYVPGKPPTRVDWGKTHHSYRTVAVPAFAGDAVRRRIAAVQHRGPEALLFATLEGRPLQQQNLRRDLKKAVERGGLDGVEAGKTHRIRKTAATIVARGADGGVELASAFLGHAPGSNLAATTYVKRLAKVDPSTAEYLDATLGTAIEKSDDGS